MRETLKKFMLPIALLVLLPNVVFADEAVLTQTGCETVLFPPFISPLGGTVEATSTGCSSDVLLSRGRLTERVDFSLHGHNVIYNTAVTGVGTWVQVISSPAPWDAPGAIMIETLSGFVSNQGNPGESLFVVATLTATFGGEEATVSYSQVFTTQGNHPFLMVGDPVMVPGMPPMGPHISRLEVTMIGRGEFHLPRSGESTITPVPEPATILLLGTGLAGVAIKMRKRLKHRKNG